MQIFGSKPAKFVDEYFALLLAGVLLLALLFRILALWSLKATPYYDILLIDESIYHRWAQMIASGKYRPQAAYEFSPLPAYMMALVYKLFSPNIVYIRFLNIIYGVLSVLFIGLTAKNLAGKSAGLAAGVIAALYKPFILYSIVPLKTALSVLMIALFCYLLVKFLLKPNPFFTALMGACAAFAFNVRGNYAVLIPVGLAAVVWKSLETEPALPRLSRLLFGFCATLLLVQAPFVIRNYQVTHELVLSTTQAGFNFYIGNNPQNPGPYYYPVPFASPVPFRQGIDFTIEASRRAGRELTAKQASGYWFHEIFTYAAEHPLKFLHKLGQKALAVCNRFESFDHYDVCFLSQFIPVLRFPLFDFWLVWPLGMAGLFLSSFLDKNARWLLLVFMAYAGSLILFFLNGRYRFPLLVVIIPFAAIGVRQAFLFRRGKDRAFLYAYAGLVLFFGLLQFAPIPGANDQSLYYNIHGNILYRSKKVEGAVHFWKKSAEMKGHFSDSAKFSLALFYYRKGKLDEAEAYLNRIGDDSYAAGRKYALLGDILFARGNWREAADAYERSLGINPGDNNVRRKLISLLDTLDPGRVRREYKERAEVKSFDKGL